jgi:hypothetical protein
MSYEERIIALLDDVNAGLVGSNDWSDDLWTKAIKRRLIQEGHKNSCKVYTSGFDGVADGGEWLFDLSWLVYEDGKVKRVEMVLESEWKLAGVDDDFQKLLLARAQLRVMIFQVRTQEEFNDQISHLCEQVNIFEQAEIGDRYLFSCWVAEDRCFLHREFVKD